MTFLKKLQEHRGGLVRLNISFLRPTALRLLSGKIGVVCSASRSPATFGAVHVCLFIDGKIHDDFFYDGEVEFLEGSG